MIIDVEPALLMAWKSEEIFGLSINQTTVNWAQLSYKDMLTLTGSYPHRKYMEAEFRNYV